ncbi:MAG: HlyD family secretion protein [Campylobacterota bacterium]|nr:HlyD family secretion protein [Campylobacterota bacterium]
MKLITFIFLTVSVLFAKEHYAKLEPYELKTISSNVSALVMFADITKEGKRLKGDEYITLDDKLDKIELKQIEKKMLLLNSTIELNQEVIKNYDALLKKKVTNFERIKSLKIKSSVEKDREFYDLVNSQNQYINTKKELENIRVQLNDLNLRKEVLLKSVSDKHISSTEFTLYKLHVKEGQFVSPSTPLADLADISKGKLVIYLSYEEMVNYKSKALYLDGVKSSYTITRVWNIADSKHLSNYRAEIVIDAPKIFSRLIKVELRDD